MPVDLHSTSVTAYAAFPPELDRDWLARVAHLSADDLAVIRRRTDPVSQLGYAVQLATASVLTVGLAEVPAHWAGLASGVLNHMQHLAGALGIAAIAAVYFTHLDAPSGASASAAEAANAFQLVAWSLVALAAATAVATRLMPRTAAAHTA